MDLLRNIGMGLCWIFGGVMTLWFLVQLWNN